MTEYSTLAGSLGIGGAIALIVWWIKGRIEKGVVTLRIGSKSGEDIELENEKLRLQLAAAKDRIEALTAERERERQLTEHWQRQLLEHLQRRT